MKRIIAIEVAFLVNKPETALYRRAPWCSPKDGAIKWLNELHHARYELMIVVPNVWPKEVVQDWLQYHGLERPAEEITSEHKEATAWIMKGPCLDESDVDLMKYVEGQAATVPDIYEKTIEIILENWPPFDPD